MLSEAAPESYLYQSDTFHGVLGDEAGLYWLRDPSSDTGSSDFTVFSINHVETVLFLSDKTNTVDCSSTCKYS